MLHLPDTFSQHIKFQFFTETKKGFFRVTPVRCIWAI